MGAFEQFGSIEQVPIQGGSFVFDLIEGGIREKQIVPGKGNTWEYGETYFDAEKSDKTVILNMVKEGDTYIDMEKKAGYIELWEKGVKRKITLPYLMRKIDDKTFEFYLMRIGHETKSFILQKGVDTEIECVFDKPMKNEHYASGKTPYTITLKAKIKWPKN